MSYLSIIGLLPLLVASVLALETNFDRKELGGTLPSSPRQQSDPTVKAQGSDSDDSDSEYDWNARANIVSEELPWPFPSSPRQQRDPAVKAQRSYPCKKDPKVMSMRRSAHKLDSSYEYYDDYDC